MSLHKKSRIFLVGLAQPFARLHRFGKAGIEIGSLGDTPAVRALPAEVRQPVRLSRRQTIQSLRQHERQRVLARAPRPRKNHSMRKTLPRQHIAQAMYGLGVTVKIREAQCLLLSG